MWLILLFSIGLNVLPIFANEPDLGDKIEVVEGDVLVNRDKPINDSSSRYEKRSAVPLRRHLWRSRSVPYMFYSMSEQTKPLVLKAFQRLQNKTCIKFREKTDTDVDFLAFKGVMLNTLCASYIGRQGGAQPVFLGISCGEGTIIHELMHALGIYHEHNRPDRNNHITIFWENILKNSKKNFEKHPDSDMLGVNYDYDSIMHYPRKGFSANNRPTIELIGDPNREIGQREKLSALDIVRINRLYDCPTSLDKGVTQWSLWSSYDCAFNCGQKSRQRFCFSGDNCPIDHETGVETQYQKCTDAECNVPINGHWERWSEETPECYPSCGGVGTRNRTRVCNDPAPRNGGRDCIGENIEYIPCRTERCDIKEFEAGFEDKGMGKWRSVGRMPWKINHGPTNYYGTGPNFDHTFGDKYGGYVYTETTGSYQGNFAVLQADEVPGGCNLTFYYHMNVEGWDPKFEVTIDDKVFFKTNGWKGDMWKRGSVKIPDGSHKVKFVVRRGRSYKCNVGLDDIKLECDITTPSPTINTEKADSTTTSTVNKQQTILQNNDFENGFGSWTRINWRLNYGETRTWKTGPKPGDHTKGDHTGQYIYMEASDVEPGYTATLENSVTTSSSTCEMMFWYNMYGADMGSLDVYVNEERVFHRSGDTGTMDWLSTKVPIPAGTDTKVRLIATRGSGILSDIALDDISFQNCE